MEVFSNIMKLKAFSDFPDVETALFNLNSIKNCDISEDLSNFISSNIKKKSKINNKI
jgi:hypothetical protein